jgi:nucleotide-binding universal stress UspA family protein
MSPPPFGGFLANDDDSVDGAPLVDGQFDGDHILVPLLTRAVPALTDQLKVATTLARATGGSVTTITPRSASERTPKAYHADVADGDDATLLEWAFEHTGEALPQVDGEFVDTRHVVRGILRAVRRRDVDTLVVPGCSSSNRIRGGVTEQLAALADADVVAVNGRAGFRASASILLPVAGGPHSGLAADVAATIAADCGAWIDVLRVVDEDATARQRDRADDLVDEIAGRIARPETTTTWVLEARNATEEIVDQSRYYDLTVLGAPTKGPLRRLIFGSRNAAIRANADSVVLSARNNASRSGVE